MKTVLLSQKIDPAGMKVLEGRCDIILPQSPTQEAFDKAAQEADAIVLRTNVLVSEETISRAKNLKIVSRTGAGVDNIDLPAAQRAGVTVCNLPSLNTIPVAEHTVAMMLCMAKRLPILDSAIRSGNWQKVRGLNLPTEVSGKTLGVVGMGAIGSLVARICADSFGMKILAYDPYAQVDKFPDFAFKNSLEELIESSDYITLHIPNQPETRGIISRGLIYKMKPEAILINCSRGGVVDESALIDALTEKRIAGAALDVFSKEPLPDSHPLMGLDNVLLTPHAAAMTRETVARIASEACRQVVDFLEGRKPKYIYK